ncbi:hypothetical protein N1851_024084 [Merluccius polli]|uniref:Uncharacterized protein n=1 Tax=Merluccius polli TaxID=89951 RepID=A0AA47MFQ0_MERPO|nr:hypothetical protein N1851_024084 [Merluccius polli]
MDRPNRRVCAASAVLRAGPLSRKAKLSIYQSIYVPTLTYGHELLGRDRKNEMRIQAAVMSSLHSVAGLSLGDRVRSSDIWRELGVRVLLPLERSQLKWFGYLIRMPLVRLPLEVFQGTSNGVYPDYISHLAWKRFGISQEELENIAGELGPLDCLA